MSAVSRGTRRRSCIISETVPQTGGRGMNPPFLFFAKKRNPPEGLLLPLRGNSPSGPFTVQRETAWGLKLDPFQGQVWAEMRGSQQETSAVEASVSVGRGPRPRNLHIPRFRLAPKAHSFRCSSSPHENRCAGFCGAPYWAETFRREARDALLPCVGLQNRFDLRFPSAAAPSISQAALSEAAAPAGAFRRPTAAKRRLLGRR